MTDWQPDIKEIVTVNDYWINKERHQDFITTLERLQATLRERDFRDLADRLMNPIFCRQFWGLVLIPLHKTYESLMAGGFDPIAKKPLPLTPEKTLEILHKYDAEVELSAIKLAKTFPGKEER